MHHFLWQDFKVFFCHSFCHRNFIQGLIKDKLIDLVFFVKILYNFVSRIYITDIFEPKFSKLYHAYEPLHWSHKILVVFRSFPKLSAAWWDDSGAIFCCCDFPGIGIPSSQLISIASNGFDANLALQYKSSLGTIDEFLMWVWT